MTDSREEAAPPVRPTPYELVFAAPGFDQARFEGVRAEANVAPALTAATLLMLPAAGDILRDLAGAADRHPGGGGAPRGQTSDASREPADPGVGQEVLARVGALVFQAYRFWLYDRLVYELDTGVLEQELEVTLRAAGDSDAWRFSTPAPAGYVQLPHHRFWARVEEDAAPEPVDGFFWSAPTVEELAAAPVIGGDRLDLLFVLGLRRGRPGVSLVDIAMEPADRLESWLSAAARPDGEDFSNILPGGELQGYRGLTTRAEALRLALVCFRAIDRRGSAEPEEAGAVRRFRVHG